MAGFEFGHDWCQGDLELNVIHFIKTPLIGEVDGLNDDGKRIAGLSDLLIIYLVFSRKRCTKLELNGNSIYDGYGRLGFFVTDKHVFDNFIVNKLGAGVHNLVDAFTTTEIADDLFKNGLMVLCWGITPWVYMITSNSGCGKVMKFPSAAHSDCVGEYFLCDKMKNLCIIPGTELLGWETGNLKQWPEIDIKGSGNIVQLDLFVLRAEMAQARDFIPIPYFNLQRRQGKINEATPILNWDIFSHK